VGLPLVSNQPIYAQESPGFEKIAAVSDRKYVQRIFCVGEPEDPNKINSTLIAAVEVVSLPSKNRI
jgi:hypothetical protein